MTARFKKQKQHIPRNCLTSSKYGSSLSVWLSLTGIRKKFSLAMYGDLGQVVLAFSMWVMQLSWGTKEDKYTLISQTSTNETKQQDMKESTTQQ